MELKLLCTNYTHILNSWGSLNLVSPTKTTLAIPDQSHLATNRSHMCKSMLEYYYKSMPKYYGIAYMAQFSNNPVETHASPALQHCSTPQVITCIEYRPTPKYATCSLQHIQFMYAFTAQQYQDVHGLFQEMGAFSPTFCNVL